MNRIITILTALTFFAGILTAQSNFNYSLELNPVTVSNLPGLHSYAFAQDNGKWLVIGGRLDGLHARQPWASFPESHNNTDIYVIDVDAQQSWSSSLNALPTALKEQLQSTNMNFYQDEDTLYIIGGYAFSASANDHITFTKLTSIDVPSTINAVINGNSISPYFKQISDSAFAITGGQLGKIDDTFYLVGGHRFDGRYNPHGNPTYTQTYSNQIRKFKIDNSGGQLSFDNYSTITDPVHLRRRDYNLLPQIFPDGTWGYTISSGVFQLAVDLPFLYPVDITANGYNPVTGFNQYLSNYHSAKACLYDSLNNEMHSLFFGGMSQYYYQGGNLVQDNQVPFVKTISRITRTADSTLQEYQLALEMPNFKGASAEFIPNHNIPHYSNEVIKLSAISQDSILIGHIYGGILSPALNPFASNQTNLTSADTTIYEVWLIRGGTTGVQEIDGANPYAIDVFPNPVSSAFTIEVELDRIVNARYFITDVQGRILVEGELDDPKPGKNEQLIRLEEEMPGQMLLLTVVIDDKFYITKKILRE